MFYQLCSVSGMRRAASDIRCLLITVILLFLPRSAPAQVHGIRTFGGGTLGRGMLEISAGAEYASKSGAPFAGAPVSLWRAPSIGLHWGASENVDVQFNWSGRLLAGYEGGSRGSDWGDPIS